jgi:hypothetical protein
MIRYSILTALLSACTAYATPLHLRWTAEASDPKPYRAEIFRGETLELRSQLRQYGVDVALPDTATASLYYQTNGMAGAWWQSPATATTSGVVSATWTPALDAGASQYVFFIGVSDNDNLIYRAYGQLRIHDSPGATPNAITPPVQTIDFSKIDIKNAPWLTDETDPVATLWQSAHLSTKNPHNVTAEQVGVDTNAIAVARAHADSAHGITPGGGFRGGSWSEALEGGAVGVEAKTTYGGAVGYYAESGKGGAVGAEALATTGGAVGYRAAAGAGFAGGEGATTLYGGEPHDAIQLGGGNNANPRSLQVYEYPLMYSNGYISLDRLSHLNATHVGALPISGGTMTGAIILAAEGVAFHGVGVATNYFIKAEYDGTNVNFNVYGVAR